MVRRLHFATALYAAWLFSSVAAAEQPDLIAYLTGERPGLMIAYTPLELDPRNPANHERTPTSSLRKDLAALRPTFDGLILYGYQEASTPRIVALAKELKFRAVLLGVWQPKSAAEVDGAARLAEQFHNDLALGVCVGNEGVTFNRYEIDDVEFAVARLKRSLPAGVPLTTSEPLEAYKSERLQAIGDFLAPNIHPVFHAEHLDAAAAAQWAIDQATRLAEQSGKPVLLKETGFPHGGKERYSPASQRDFWRAYTAGPLAPRLNGKPDVWIYRGAAFEAFDLAWKAEASGLPVERFWGLFSAQREPLPALEVWKSLPSSR